MDISIDFLKNRPLSLASNSSGGSQLVASRKLEKRRFGGSFSGSSEGCVSDDASARQSIIRFSSEPYLSNSFETSHIKSSSLCNFYQYYYDQFLTAKSKKSSTYCLLAEPSENHESLFQSSIRNIINELLETENAYVKDLHDIINGYLLPMEKDSHVTNRENELIFGNIRSLFSFNQRLLRELRECGTNVESVSSTFIRNNHNFLLYSSYCSNYPRCLEAIEKCMGKEKTRNLLSTLQSTLTHPLPLAAYLLKPIQRISKYHLFFQNIINCYSPSTSPSNPTPTQLLSTPIKPPSHYLSSSSRPLQKPSSSSSLHQNSSSSPLHQQSSLSLRLPPTPPQQLKSPHYQKKSPFSPSQQSSLKSLRNPPSPLSKNLSSPLLQSNSASTPTSKSSTAAATSQLKTPSKIHQRTLTPTKAATKPSATAAEKTATTTASAAQQATREALSCMNKVLEHINQANTLRKHSTNMHVRTHKEEVKGSKRAPDIGDLLFKEKFYEESGRKSVYHLFLFSKAVLVTRKRSKKKHLVKVLFETKDVVLLEDVPSHPTCFYLISKLNSHKHIKLEAKSVDQKVHCCHQLKRVVTCDVSKQLQDHVIITCLTDSCSVSGDKSERVIDKSSFISIEGTSSSPHHKKTFKRTNHNLECTPNLHHSTSHNLSQLKSFSMLVASKRKAVIDVKGAAGGFEDSKNNYLFTLKLPRAKKNAGKGFFSAYKEAHCTDICMEGCEGVYKRVSSQSQLQPSPPCPPSNAHHPNLSLNHKPEGALKIDCDSKSNFDMDANTPSENSNDSELDGSVCRSVDFYYEDKMLGDLDSVSVVFEDSDFEDSRFSDENPLSCSPFNSNAALVQCLESAF